jgi:2-keto-3-deoxy-L-rhamnonate aldolase RhmA
VRNAVKHAASSRERIRGFHLTFGEPAIIEILASVGLDFVYLDGEHGAFGPRDIEACCVAAERHGMTAIARIPDRTAATITNFLDRGVLGLVVPHVDSLADAKEVVEAAYYGPLGSRSFGGSRPHYGLGIKDQPAHLAECNARTSVCIMIESVGALEAAADIATLPGIDYLSYGLNDLAQALGFPGQPNHPDVVAAVGQCTDRIRAAGKPVREDFMRFAWVKDLLVAGARHLLD